MKYNKLTICLVLAITLSILGGFDIANAKSRSSRSYSSSKSYRSSKTSSSVWGSRSGGGYFSSSSKSSSSYSKPAKSTSKKSSSTYSKPSKTTSKSSSTYSKPTKSNSKTTQTSGYKKPQKTVTFSKPGSTGMYSSSSSNVKSSKFDKKLSSKKTAANSKSSYTQYKDSKAKFKQKPTTTYSANSKSNKLSYKVNRNWKFDDKADSYERSRYYSNRDWRAPGYIYNSRPSFGMWDSLCLWMMLDNLTSPGHAQTFYNHQNDPGMQEWRAEADKLAETNAELRAKLNELDSTTASMTGPIDPSYLPASIPVGIALAPEALKAISSEPPVLRFATASKTGNYNYFGKIIKNKAKDINVELINTSGSLENLGLLLSGKADAAMIQSDALLLFEKHYPKSKLITEQTVIYPEAVQMIANRDSGIKSVKDIDPDKHVLYIGPKGSGTSMTWESFCKLDSRYKKIQTFKASYEQALKRVQENPNAVMMFVSGLNSEFLKKADSVASSGSGLRLVTVDDWDFNDASDPNGNDIYKFIEIPSGVYPSLQKGWIGGNDVETIAVKAVMVLNSNWIDKNGAENLNSLSSTIVEAKSAMQKKISAKGN